jgi:hypothetical protein
MKHRALEEKANPFEGQALATADFSDDYSGSIGLTEAIEEANVVVSLIEGYRPGARFAQHKPVLDIDLPVQVLPSSTPGHSHLFIDKELTWEQYTRLLYVLADIGIIETGYRTASLVRGYTAVRLPWIKK